VAVTPLLDLAAARLEAAAAQGALAPGDAAVRTLVLWAGAQGLTLFTHRDRLQPPARRVAALAPELVASLLRGWEGEPRAVKAAVAAAGRALA
jgi:hypothetical protein